MCRLNDKCEQDHTEKSFKITTVLYYFYLKIYILKTIYVTHAPPKYFYG